jgi:hypothetical protein
MPKGERTTASVQLRLLGAGPSVRGDREIVESAAASRLATRPLDLT